MTDEEFRALRQLILDLNVEVKGLACAVRLLAENVNRPRIDGFIGDPVGMDDVARMLRIVPDHPK